MNASCKTPIHRALMFALLPLAVPFVAAAGVTEDAAGTAIQADQASSHSTLINDVRRTTARYRDINVALHHEKGWSAGPCVSGPDTGAMGVHLVQATRLADGVLSVDAPEALIYEPLPGGAMRLVGVEFIQLADDWAARNPNGGPPTLEGNLMNLVGAPNRFGLPAFYELHVWAWEDNPKGSFADWNTNVSCTKQPSE